jgi:hypothetical protein
MLPRLLGQGPGPRRCNRRALTRLGNEPSRFECGVSSARPHRAETLLGKARRALSRAGLPPGSGITRLGLARLGSFPIGQ